jgi:hypothetical protein
MKNSLYIDFDSEREDKVKITKPKTVVEEIMKNKQERQMIVDDLTTCMNALGTLIQAANDNNIVESNKSAQICVEYLTENFIKQNG